VVHEDNNIIVVVVEARSLRSGATSKLVYRRANEWLKKGTSYWAA
jgi:hypothetical protein